MLAVRRSHQSNSLALELQKAHVETSGREVAMLIILTMLLKGYTHFPSYLPHRLVSFIRSWVKKSRFSDIYYALFSAVLHWSRSMLSYRGTWAVWWRSMSKRNEETLCWSDLQLMTRGKVCIRHYIFFFLLIWFARLNIAIENHKQPIVFWLWRRGEVVKICSTHPSSKPPLPYYRF